MTDVIHLLAAIRPDAADRYEAYFATQEGLTPQVVQETDVIREHLRAFDNRVDVVVIDNSFDNVFETVRDLRQSYPRLLIVLVDEGADFSMPGRADDVSTAPFKDDDLMHRIQRLIQERRTATLRADSLPPVRDAAKKLRQARGATGKAEAAVEAIHELGYDFVAYYRLEAPEAPLTLNASAGLRDIIAVAPDRQKPETLPGWVAQNGQMRIVGAEDDPNYILVKRGRLGAGVCLPVGTANRYGVLVACREAPGSISQENAMLLELVSAQLAAALAKDSRG